MGKALMGLEETYDRICRALESFMSGAAFTDAVIGLSGGIDSALVATIAVDAIGSDRVHGVILPGPYTSPQSVEDAKELAENLSIGVMEMSIRDICEAVGSEFLSATGARLKGLAAENVQSRCRTVLIMALSNSFGWMMLNTGNKSEAAMGYSTLYGDTAGAFAPIGGLYKTEVYKLARWRNSSECKLAIDAPIPIDSIERPPSAELSSGQTDETSMGIDYPTLDAILRGMNDEGRTEDDMCRSGFAPEDIMRVMSAYRRNEFKRAQEPPFPPMDFV